MKRKQRKVLSILLSLAMLCSLAMPTAFAADSRYIDTTDHWAETAINRWSDYDVIEGYGDAFNPDNSITRGQMATILSKTLGLTEEAENPFSDISADDWYAPYVLRCYKAGIMLGDDGKANPDAEITRQEAMTMFCRAFGIKAEETADLTSFKDSGAIADWALPYVSALINGGIVSGVSSDMIAPAESMSRAALVTILDRAVVQYINTSGEYDLTDKEGIILVTAGDTTLKGETKANILITQAADGKAVTFKDASVTGAVTVQADTKIINNNSKLPEIDATVEEVKKETPKKPSGGSSGGSSRPTISNLTINEEKTVTSGTYNNVTITDAVADGEVTLSNVTINGDLTIKGGGSSSIKLNNCTIQGKVIMAKETGETPRLELTNTPVATVEVQKPAIIEAVDSASAVAKIEATANIEIKGENTKIDTLAIPETAESAVAVTVTAGRVETVEAKAETSVTGASNSVDTIVATAAVTADSEAVQKVEIPETATESVSVTVTGDAAVDVEINSTSGAAVTGANVTVSTTLETAPDNITVGGTAVTHIHKWGEPVTTPATCDQDGENVYTCIADGCDDVAETKTEVITKLGHKYGDWQKSDDDLHFRECANNKAHYEKGEHTWDEGKITTEATCGQEGVKTYTCSVCKGTKTETIGKPEHNWGDWVKVDATNHKRVCKNNATHIETADHTPIIDSAVDATCTETGKTEGSHCDICNSVIIEQTTTPALKHDFTGEYEEDADGHWHICERDNCEETDTKAGHTYNTTNCAEVATCTVCNYEKAAGEHTWSDWEKVDDTNHKRTCSCTATETEDHKWDDGKITTEPTETTEGVKTYTCSECKGTKTEAVPAIPEEDEPTYIYTFNEEKGLRIKWTEATLSEGQSYYVTIKEPSSQYICTSASFPVGGFTSKDNVVSGKISITVDVGTGWKETSALYEETEIANITVNSTVPQFTIEKDDNGAYNFVSDANGGLWVYAIYNEEGLLTYSGNAINGAIDSYANFESGCKVVARYMTWSLSDDKDYAEITLTQQAEYTYKETASTDVKITLVQDGDKIKATWTGTDSPNYYFMVADENGTLSGGWWVDGVCEVPDLVTFFPRVDTSSAYSFVLYAATEDYIKGEELARLENCFDITVSGEPMNYEMAFNTPEDGEHTITLGTAIPANVHHLGAWYRNNKLSSMDSGKASYETAAGSTFTRNHSSIQDGDVYDLRLLTTYTLEGQTIKATMTPASKKTYEVTGISFRKWNTDIMFDGYEDVVDTMSLEVGGIKVLSTEAGTMSEFLFEYDQTKGNITDADFVVEVDGVEKERISKNVDVTLSNTDVAFTINTDGTLSFDATTHGSFAYKTTKGGSGRIAFKNGTLVDGWTLPTLADGETIDIMHIDCTYDETTKSISATISNHTSKTYTATSDKNIWFSENEYGRLMLNWKAVELASDERYYYGKDANGYDGEYIETQHSILDDVANVETAETRSVTIFKGTWLDHDEVLYTAEDVISVSISGATQNYNVVGQSDGKYKIVPTDDNFARNGFFYEIYTPDGTKLCGNFTSSGNISASLYDGCKIKIREIKWIISDDAKTVNIILTPISTVETFTQVSVPAETVNVTTFAELESALTIGGKVQLANNITSDEALMIYTGAASELILNGYVLDLPKIQIESAKTLVIDGTVEGSQVKYTDGQNTIRVYSGASLTLNNGKYECIYSSNGREIIINNASIISPIEQSAVHLYFVPNVKISEGTYETSGNGSAISVMGCGNVEIDNVSLKGTYSGFNAQQTEKAVISNSSFVGESYSIQVVDNTSLTLSGNTLLNNKPFNISGNSSISAIIGTYDMDMTDYLADGYALTDNEDGTYTVSGETASDVKITLVQDGDSIKATWNDSSYPNYYFEIEDNTGKSVMNGWSNTGTSEISVLELYIPRTDSGTNTYSLVIYAADENFDADWDNEFARLDNCIEVSVAGDAVEYIIDFNVQGTGEHTIILDSTPIGISHIETWYRNSRVIATGSGGISTTLTEHHILQDGDIYDLRMLTAYTLENQVIKATITPPSQKTYIAPKITLVQEDSIIKATWTGVEDAQCLFEFVDSSGDVAYTGIVGADSGDLAILLPRIEEGTQTYSFVLYSIDSNYNKASELARLENAVEVTISGDAVEYDMSLNDGQEGKHTITWKDNQLPTGIYQLGAWYDKSGAEHGRSCGDISTPVGAIDRVLQDGDTYDVRIITSYTLDGNTLKTTMTPASLKTYTVPVTE